jgi:hypothetical protein
VEDMLETGEAIPLQAGRIDITTVLTPCPSAR